MAVTLIINPGSTSKKYALYKEKRCIFTMRFEHTGDGFAVCREICGESQLCENVSELMYEDSFNECIKVLISKKLIGTIEDITQIGVRVVAPGGFFREHRVVDSNYITTLENSTPLAPLHIPPVLSEIKIVKKAVKYAQFIAVSDSAFHESIPEERRTISISSSDAHNFGIIRYGYHGLSVASISRRLESFFGILPERVIVAHIGGGISLTALHIGRSVDTTMGYSPASGMVMGTRAGDLEADALVSLMVQKGVTVNELDEYINLKSGFNGITGVSDLRTVINKASVGDRNSEHALQVLKYQFQRQVGALSATLEGLDAIVLTATAAVRNPQVREILLEDFGFMGMVLDKRKNDELINSEGMIHDNTSGVSLGVMKTDEMSEIFRIVESMYG